LDEKSTLSLPCLSASDESYVCCLSKESAEIESVLEANIICNPISKKPRYEQFSYDGQKIPLGMSFKTPPLFDHYGESDEDVEVFFVLEAKSISGQPSNENESFCQEQHVKEKQPSFYIHEDISCHQLVDVIKKGKREMDQRPASVFHSPVLATDIQRYVNSCKA
jgi:hypothetical protein